MKKERRCGITSKIIINDFRSVHGDKYDYSLVDYKTMHTKVKIICPIHGEFEQEPVAHFLQKQGCNACGTEIAKGKQKSNTEVFIKRCKETHKDIYDYSLTEYGKNAFDKVKIICKEHGIFEMSPNNFISKKQNCPVCAKRKTGWTKTSWKNSCEGKIAKLYFIRCYNEDESFYKIGITNKSTIEGRFYCKFAMPYKYEVLKVLEAKNDPVYVYDLERCLHLIHKKVRYIPKIHFAGDTECFSEIIINYSLIH